MGVEVYPYGFLTFGYHSETTGTAITEEIPCNTDGRMAIIQGSVTPGDSAETLSLMYAEGDGSRNEANADAAAGQAELVTVDAPKDPAGNAAASGDIIAYQTYDGTWEFNTVSSISGNTITLGTNIAKKVLEGAKVNIIGAQGDGAEFQIAAPASATKEFGDGNIYLVHPYKGEPMYLSLSNSGIGDAQLDNLVVAFINK